MEQFKNIANEWLVNGFNQKLNSSYGSQYYVYALINSLDNQIFYIGKGKGKRAENHLQEFKSGKVNNGKKYKKISEILSKDGVINIHVIKNELNEKDAYALESKFINWLKPILTNYQNGVIPQSEKDILWAKSQLNKMVDFETWKSRTNPSKYFINLFKEIREELKLIASGEKKIIRGVRIINDVDGQRVEYF